MRASKKLLLPAIIGFALFTFLFLPNWKAIGMIMGIGFDEHSFQPLSYFTEKPSRERLTIDGADHPVTFDVYMTSSEGKGMIVYTPFISGGLDDPQIVRIADTFARLGYTVAVPSKEIGGSVIGAQDTEDLIAVANFLKEERGVNEIGFMGLCFGNGPVFAAATDDRIKDDVRFVIAFAPFYDFQNAVSFLKTGTYEYEGEIFKKDPAPYGTELVDMSLAYHHLSDLPLDQALQSPAFVSLRESLSPAKHLDDIDFNVYLIHSLDDGFIPYTETLRLRDALEDRTHIRFLLSQVFTHEEFRPVTIGNLVQFYLPEAWRLYRFYSVFLATESS